MYERAPEDKPTKTDMAFTGINKTFPAVRPTRTPAVSVASSAVTREGLRAENVKAIAIANDPMLDFAAIDYPFNERNFERTI
jgi:hypothetical protein